MKNVGIAEKIRGKVGLIDFFDIFSPDSDLHDSSELPNDENLDFSAKMLCLKMEKIWGKVGLIKFTDMDTACSGFSFLKILKQAISAPFSILL